MLVLGRADPMNSGVTAAELVVLAGSPAHAIWPGSPAACPLTLALARQSVAGWSPDRHHLFHIVVRSTVRTVLLASVRLRSIAHAAAASRDTAGGAHEQSLWLPCELWLAVCHFLTRADWPSPPPPPTAVWGDGVVYDPEMFLGDGSPCGLCPDGYGLRPQTTDRPGHACTACGAALPAGAQLYSCGVCDPCHNVCSDCHALKP